MKLTDEIGQLYEQTSAATLRKWANQPHHARSLTPPAWHPTKLAIVTGMTPPMPPALKQLRQQLAAMADGDQKADVIPAASFHITFMAITDSIYDGAVLPEHSDEVIHLFHSLRLHHLRLSALRLVALPNQLLIAGIADESCVAERKKFADGLLASSWSASVKNRYGNITLPPPFWHSTLLRYRGETLPECYRQFFIQHRQLLIPEVTGKLRLVMSNYNWTEVHDFADCT